jgi:hypothetical protein
LIDAPKKAEEKKPEPIVEEEAPFKKLEHMSPPMRKPGGFMNKRGGKVAPAKKASAPAPVEPVKKGKQARVWELGGTKADVAVLDYSSVVSGQQDDNVPADTNRESENLYSQNVSPFN